MIRLGRGMMADSVGVLARAVLCAATLAAGTGSCPQPPQGWQRQRRRVASQEPRRAPCVSIASRAYWEQVGSNRQPAVGPNNTWSAGEMIRWYARTHTANMLWAGFTVGLARSGYQFRFPQGCQKIAFHFGKPFPGNRGPGYQHHVHACVQVVLMQSKTLTQEPPRPVPHHCASNFPGRNHTQPRGFRSCRGQPVQDQATHR